MKKRNIPAKMIEDGSGLRIISLEELICKDCKHRLLRPTIKCKKYESKPAAVFKGKCSEYEKEKEWSHHKKTTISLFYDLYLNFTYSQIRLSKDRAVKNG